MAYSNQIGELIKLHRTHIKKEDFLPAFYAAFQAAITESNIRGGFRGASLVPFNPEHVISQLDLRLKTPTPPSSRPGTAQPWVSKTLNNPTEASSQSTFIKNRIFKHQNSSPTLILEAIDQFTKGASKVIHKLSLLKAENQALRQANEELSKRRRAKKIHLRKGGSLSVQDGQDLQDQNDIAQQIEEETRKSSGRKPRTETYTRRCGICGEPGHNTRTCENGKDMPREEDSD